MKIFITGGSSGVGQACSRLLGKEHKVTAPSRTEFDLNNFEAIDQIDLSAYDVVINCAGANPGSYLGWQHNSWHNQVTQVNINFTAALMLAKQYTKQRSTGQFVYITSTNINDPIAYNIFYTASKFALKYSVNTIARDFPNIIFTEICPGKIKSGMLEQNYQGSKTTEEIEELYAKSPFLKVEEIARVIEYAIKYKLDNITISPHD